KHRHRGCAPVTQASEREKRENRRDQIAIGGRYREGTRQLRRDETWHQEHQAIDAQAGVKKKRGQRLLWRAILDARPKVPSRDQSEHEERNRVADEEVQMVRCYRHRASSMGPGPSRFFTSKPDDQPLEFPWPVEREEMIGIAHDLVRDARDEGTRVLPL